MPNVIVIAGPNGAGKSTLAPDLLKAHFSNAPFINADSIAEELNDGKATNVDLKAGRVMLGRMRTLAGSGEDFAFETTLSARSYLRFLRDLQALGYTVQVAYLWLPDVQLSIQRVAERVRVGGHNIPTGTIRRRFKRSLDNFLELYLAVADAWRFYDASGDKPILIASGDRLNGETIIDKTLWQQIKNQ